MDLIFFAVTPANFFTTAALLAMYWIVGEKTREKLHPISALGASYLPVQPLCRICQKQSESP
jgi:hypothetical protein